MTTSGRAIRNPLARDLQGTRAGIVSRLAANALDVATVFVLLIATLLAFSLVRFLLTASDFRLADPGPWGAALLEIGIATAYLFSGWAGTGRTVGKQLLGLRVVTDQGEQLSPPRAFARALICVLIGGPLLLWAAVSRRNAAVYDHILGTAVLYDWTGE